MKSNQKSMSQIHKNEGIPVKIKTVKPELFEKNLEYTGTLTGNRQSSLLQWSVAELIKY